MFSLNIRVRLILDSEIYTHIYQVLNVFKSTEFFHENTNISSILFIVKQTIVPLIFQAFARLKDIILPPWLNIIITLTTCLVGFSANDDNDCRIISDETHM